MMATTLPVVDLGRRVVARLAPDELPLFDQTWQAVGERPRRRVSRQEPLGFGLPGADEVLVTAVASGVVTAVVSDLGKDLGSWSARLLGRLRLRRRVRAVPSPLPVLPPRRLRQIRAIAFRKARKLGMPVADANALADALISELTTTER
ncbi:hypothetical protein AB0M05_38715 [Streptomyces violaceusniger]|uniref:hypothetical protein n=1 Tax=Streptomyces TaxID=1883 RepID=UPI001ABD0D1C|nr:hypothetical protein [Streptomyces sp. NEAU-YJ-81]MBO3681644.1 hypothetical protein [Streptomyces sp. NEAU-YJ-81]